VYLINIGTWEHFTLTVRSCNVATFTTLTPLSLLIKCKLSFPFVGLKISSLSKLAFKSDKIFVWQEYLWNSSNICFTSS
jgi:hypothetical protein